MSAALAHQLLVAVLLLLGLSFILLANIGVLRFPDFYTRLHAVGKCDTLGVALSLGALAVHEGLSLTGLKILSVLVFIALANPTATHALGRAALRSGLKPWTGPGSSP